MFKQLNSLFYPDSIAVVGASPDKPTIGNVYLTGLISAGFRGNLYPVNPKGGEIEGLKVYPSLTAIPYPVDYVIVSIPRESVLHILDECITKRIKWVQFFTAGFREADLIMGGKLEEEMLAKAKQGKFRIVGPNCVGIYSPEAKIPLGPLAIIGSAGTVGFLCQSGGISEKVAELGISRGIDYSKGLSLGNGIDLDATDFLEYFAADNKTQIIGVYVEGVKDARHFLRVLEEATAMKPVVVYRGGATESGARAALSHTGSLAADVAIWSAALKQAGAVEVHSVEELADNLLLFQNLRECVTGKVAIISGLAGGGGGTCVSATDDCIRAGLEVPAFAGKTQRELTEVCGLVGTILHNPVDVGPRGWSDPETFGRVLQTMSADPEIELIMVYEDMYRFKQLNIPWEAIEKINGFIIKIGKKKPMIVVLPYGAADEARLKKQNMLIQAGISVFPNFERAARALVRMRRVYSARHNFTKV